ncbi:MAG: glycosyltransferase family 2 protein [Flavobacteriaceae bacterium]
MKSSYVPKISIIIPVYKVEKYLRVCLDSLCVQTLTDIEIICINDGSPDNCIEILKEYAKKDKRFHIINQENCGSGPARNNGIDHAKGEFIGFVDPDDWVSPDYFEILYNKATTSDADISATASVVKVYDDPTRKSIKKSVGFRSEKIIISEEKRESLICRSGTTCNKVFKKNLVDKYNIRFAETRSTGEDNPFNIIALAAANKIATTTMGTYFYRFRSDSATNKRSLKDIGIVEVYADIFSQIKELNLGEKYLNIIKKRALKDFGNTYSKLNPELRKKLLTELSQKMSSIRFNSTFRKFFIDLRWWVLRR